MDYALGIDIGGTNSRISLCSREGVFVEIVSIKTSEYKEYNNFIKKIIENIKTLLEKYPNCKPQSIGIGAPNGNIITGAIEYAANLPWKGKLPIVLDIKSYLKLPTYLSNDANLAALGEYYFGIAKGVDNFVEVTIGTGLGSGFIVNGQLLYGFNGMAGELGHITLYPSGRSCGCGREGCVECYISASGIVKNYIDEVGINSSIIDVKSITAKDIYDLAISGQKEAINTFDKSGYYLAQALISATLITAPKMIVLFGGVTNAGDLLLEPTKKYFNELVLKNYRKSVEIVISTLPNEKSSLLGAIALAFNKR